MSSLISDVKVGSDPEVFLIKDDKPLSAVGIIPGEKYEPHQLGKGRALQRDNVMAEYNTAPVSLAKDFVEEHRFCLDAIQRILPAGVGIAIVPSMEFLPSQLLTEEAAESGCSEDFDAYELDALEPVKLRNRTMRFAGGHIHVGYNNPNDDNSIDIVKMLDLTLGIPALIMDDDTERKRVYGTPGRFRPKYYGLEYRTLSNFWVKSALLQQWAFESTLSAIAMVNSDFKVDHERVKNVILEHDQYAALSLMDEYGIKMPESFEKQFKNYAKV